MEHERRGEPRRATRARLERHVGPLWRGAGAQYCAPERSQPAAACPVHDDLHRSMSGWLGACACPLIVLTLGARRTFLEALSVSALAGLAALVPGLAAVPLGSFMIP